MGNHRMLLLKFHKLDKQQLISREKLETKNVWHFFTIFSWKVTKAIYELFKKLHIIFLSNQFIISGLFVFTFVKK